MPARKKINMEKVMASLATPCPQCGYQIPPAEKAEQAGYGLRESQDFVKADGMDYFLIFTRKPD